MLLSKGRFSIKGGMLSIFIFTIVTIPMYLLFKVAFSVKYVQLGLLLVGIFFSIVTLFGLYVGGKEYAAVDIYSDHLTIKWFWGAIRLKILPGDIMYFSICKVGKTDSIVFKKTSHTYIIPADFISNIDELKVQLKQWQVKRRDSIQYNVLSRTQKKMIGLFCAIVGMAMLIVMATPPYPAYKRVNSKHLVLLRGHLHASPGIIKPGGRSHVKGVNFFLDEYPGFIFNRPWHYR